MSLNILKNKTSNLFATNAHPCHLNHPSTVLIVKVTLLYCQPQTTY
jgi:hypothetical protein